MSRLTTVLFDLDDTLFDHRHSSRTALSALQTTYPDHLRDYSIDELERSNLEILNDIHVGVLDGTTTVEDARIQRFTRLFRHFGATLDREQILHVSALYRTMYQQSRRAAIGASDLLRALRKQGLTIGIVTNNLVEEQVDKLRSIGLTAMVDSMTISEEAGYAKPDSRIFQLALQRLGATPETSVMIGDSWSSDIIGARNVGMRAIWYNCYSEQNLDERIEQIESFEDVRTVLKLILES